MPPADRMVRCPGAGTGCCTAYVVTSSSGVRRSGWVHGRHAVDSSQRTNLSPLTQNDDVASSSPAGKSKPAGAPVSTLSAPRGTSRCRPDCLRARRWGRLGPPVGPGSAASGRRGRSTCRHPRPGGLPASDPPGADRPAAQAGHQRDRGRGTGGHQPARRVEERSSGRGSSSSARIRARAWSGSGRSGGGVGSVMGGSPR